MIPNIYLGTSCGKEITTPLMVNSPENSEVEFQIRGMFKKKHTYIRYTSKHIPWEGQIELKSYQYAFSPI